MLGIYLAAELTHHTKRKNHQILQKAPRELEKNENDKIVEKTKYSQSPKD